MEVRDRIAPAVLLAGLVREDRQNEETCWTLQPFRGAA